MPITIPQSKYSALLRAAVYGYLVRECLTLTVNTVKDVDKAWGLDLEDIQRLGIVSVPSDVTNLIAACACRDRFGDQKLQQVPGFYKSGKCWWLDIDDRFARRGLIVPLRRRCGLINVIAELQIFRHVRDQHPFRLRTRAERIAT